MLERKQHLTVFALQHIWCIFFFFFNQNVECGQKAHTQTVTGVINSHFLPANPHRSATAAV